MSVESCAPEVCDVEIDRKRASSLGLSLTGGGTGSPLVIAAMTQDGAAARTGRLQVIFLF